MIRLFIAIPIPKDVKNLIKAELEEIKKKFINKKDARFIPEESWHFTITFLGWQKEEEIEPIRSALEGALPQINKPTINFDRFIYGPLDQTPRMIWLTTKDETSAHLGEIKNKLEDTLTRKKIKWQRESRPYQGHLTLCRFEPQRREDLPRVVHPTSLGFRGQSLDLMQSTLMRSGAEYKKLFGIVLQ